MASLFPPDGTAVYLVSYDIKQKDDGDGTVDFCENLPDLRAWLGDAFAKAHNKKIPRRLDEKFVVITKSTQLLKCGYLVRQVVIAEANLVFSKRSYARDMHITPCY